jgi:hypothetical protein
MNAVSDDVEADIVRIISGDPVRNRLGFGILPVGCGDLVVDGRSRLVESIISERATCMALPAERQEVVLLAQIDVPQFGAWDHVVDFFGEDEKTLSFAELTTRKACEPLDPERSPLFPAQGSITFSTGRVQIWSAPHT